MAMDVATMMLESFRQMPEEQQKEAALLAGNAKFVLRMTEGLAGDDSVGRAVRAIREALTRGIPSLGGESLR